MANKEPKMGEIVYLGQRRQQKLRQEAKQQKQQQRALLQMRVVRWLYGALAVCLVLAVVLWQGLSSPSPAGTPGETQSTAEQGGQEAPSTAAGQSVTAPGGAPEAETSLPEAQTDRNDTGLQPAQESWQAAQAGAALSSQSQVALAQPEQPSQKEELNVDISQTGPQQLQQPASGTWNRLYGYGYDDTWQDYRFHQGVDMELPQGSDVSAVGTGTVLAVRQDPVQGTLVDLDLGGGMVATYGGLEPRQGLAAGDQLTAGEVIGSVAASPVDEAGQPPHIHLEIQVNGTVSDPLTLLPD